jgi:hypothetical protein
MAEILLDEKQTWEYMRSPGGKTKRNGRAIQTRILSRNLLTALRVRPFVEGVLFFALA